MATFLHLKSLSLFFDQNSEVGQRIYGHSPSERDGGQIQQGLATFAIEKPLPMFDQRLDLHLARARGPSGDAMTSRSSSERTLGIVTRFKRERGYGFVIVDGRPDVFLHVSDVERARRRGHLPDYALDGRKVSFRIETDNRDPKKCKAVDLRLAELARSY